MKPKSSRVKIQNKKSEVLGDVAEAILKKEEDVSRDQNVNSTVQCRTVTSGDGDTDVLLKFMSSVECQNPNNQETPVPFIDNISPMFPSTLIIPNVPLTTPRPSAPSALLSISCQFPSSQHYI